MIHRDHGSSPLARGLRTPPSSGGRFSGIIPARAGFTVDLDASHVWSPDHPRSRGVYPRTETPVWSAEGSSPLARGLPEELIDNLTTGRIIPARAGFTPPGGGSPGRPGDHPRSRGVYPSPPPPPPSPSSDHPRSRGVYCRRRSCRRDPSGSSPLARGLRSSSTRCEMRRGIIPARAGFTLPSNRRSTTRSDHPRSRGVYPVNADNVLGFGGSSPLARGLRRRLVVDDGGHRIIPARAGFTGGRCRRRCSSGDHPRSRGVYTPAAAPVATAGGSSPLARGLRVSRSWELSLRRIIPARAGFTPPDDAGSTTDGDHPRSRGVYPTPTSRTDSRPGSSPLARGLPGGVQVEIGAGVDHPRSRGVYIAANLTFASGGGSSPLARGLRGQPARQALFVGIIPARAGFTADRRRDR